MQHEICLYVGVIYSEKYNQSCSNSNGIFPGYRLMREASCKLFILRGKSWLDFVLSKKDHYWNLRIAFLLLLLGDIPYSILNRYFIEFICPEYSVLQFYRISWGLTKLFCIRQFKNIWAMVNIK